MSDLLMSRPDSAKRPANPWFWIAIVALIALAVWGLIAFTSRPAPPPDAGAAPPPAPAPAAPAESPPPPPAPVASHSTAPESLPPPAAAAPDNSAALLNEARSLKAGDNFQGAREKLEALLAAATNPTAVREAQDLLGEINIGLVTSPRQMPEKTDYTVQPGDTLDKIARKFGTSIDLIMKGNNLSRSMVRINERLRVFSGKFAIKVDKSDNTLTLLMNDRFFKRYHVGTGQYNRTPVGTFKITDKIPQPTWWRADGKAIPYGDPENLLGTHWLAIDVPGYGIHGTWETNTIGKQSSAGCIRLLNTEVEELFTLVPVGTPVVIED
jgi:lipoprotein-anchoring transpeptidase ErfK/SrfK